MKSIVKALPEKLAGMKKAQKSAARRGGACHRRKFPMKMPESLKFTEKSPGHLLWQKESKKSFLNLDVLFRPGFRKFIF